MKTEGSFPRWKSVISLWKCQISTRGILTKSHGFCPGGGISQNFPRRAALPGKKTEAISFPISELGDRARRLVSGKYPKKRKEDFQLAVTGHEGLACICEPVLAVFTLLL